VGAARLRLGAVPDRPGLPERDQDRLPQGVDRLVNWLVSLDPPPRGWRPAPTRKAARAAAAGLERVPVYRPTGPDEITQDHIEQFLITWSSETTRLGQQRSDSAINQYFRSLQQAVQRRGQEADIEVHPHLFRHTVAHEWLNAGGGEQTLMDQMGWSSPQMLRRYGASGRAQRRPVSEYLPEPVGGAPSRPGLGWRVADRGYSGTDSEENEQ